MSIESQSNNTVGKVSDEEWQSITNPNTLNAYVRNCEISGNQIYDFCMYAMDIELKKSFGEGSKIYRILNRATKFILGNFCKSIDYVKFSELDLPRSSSTTNKEYCDLIRKFFPVCPG